METQKQLSLRRAWPLAYFDGLLAKSSEGRRTRFLRGVTANIAQKHEKRGPKAALSDFLLLYPVYQSRQGKVDILQDLFPLANVQDGRIGGPSPP